MTPERDAMPNEIWAAMLANGTTYWMSHCPPNSFPHAKDMGPTKYTRVATDQSARIERLTAALRPFAKISENATALRGMNRADIGIWSQEGNIPGKGMRVTLADCDAARAALGE